MQLPVTVNRSVSLLPCKLHQIIQQSSNIRSPTNTSTLIKNIAAATKRRLQTIRKEVFKRKEQQINTLHYSSNSPSNINYNLRQRPSTIIPSNNVIYYSDLSYSSDSSHYNASNSSSSFTSNDWSRRSPINYLQPEILFHPIFKKNEDNSIICSQSSKNDITIHTNNSYQHIATINSINRILSIDQDKTTKSQ